ncbi:MAG: hypothetical protein O3C18_08515 [Bacteroidetes bacterium]|nr:hypothetical protein [Bacteroidota bacterium]
MACDSAGVLMPSVQPMADWLKPGGLRPTNEWFQGLAVAGDARQIVGDFNGQATAYGLSTSGTGLERLGYSITATRWRMPLGFPLVHEASNHRTMDGLGRAVMINERVGQIDRLEAHMSWALSPSVEFRFGQEGHHWGPGARSLFLDRHMAPAPSARLWVDAGVVQYAHVLMRTRHSIPGLDSAEVGWMAAHQAEVVLGGGFSGTVFGAVKWRGHDVAVERRIEPHYLVPFVAFRPMEYGQGSADNALVGAQLTWRGPTRRQHQMTAYAQGLLDEFLWSKLRNEPHWWGNKWGLLMGTHLVTRSGKFGWLVEGSAVRPWTYTHQTQPLSFSHNHQPLGHPAGANFVECRMRLSMALPRDMTLRVGVLRRWQGLSTGGDEFLLGFAAGEMPWTSFSERESDGDQTLLQGARSDLTRLELDLSHPVGSRYGVGGVEVFVRAWTRLESREDGVPAWQDPWTTGRVEAGLRQSRVMDERDW